VTRSARFLLLAALGLLISAQPAAAQPSPELAPIPGARFPERSFVLTLPPGSTLLQDQVRVFENGKRASRLSVTPAEAVNSDELGVVLVIDASSSMRGQAIQDAVGAARVFATHRNPQQRLGIVTFNQTATVKLPLTTDAAAIDSSLSTVPRAESGTHLYDALSTALAMLEKAKIKAGSIVILTDGADTRSAIAAKDVAAHARAQGVRIFSVALRPHAFDRSALRDLAASANGAYTEGRTSRDLASIYDALGSQLAHAYLIHYRSLATLGSMVHVEIDGPGITGAVATSYQAPPVPGGDEPSTAHPTGFWGSTLAMILIAATSALLVGLCVVAIFRLRPRADTVRRRMAGFVSPPPEADEHKSGLPLTGKVLEDVERSLAHSKRWATFKEDLEIARIDMPAVRVVARTVIGTLVAAWLMAVARGSGLVALLGCGVPIGVVGFVKRAMDRPRKPFTQQLGDNLTVIASAMRAGHSFVGALSVAVEDAPEPAQTEFRRMIADEKLGISLEEGLKVVARRMQSADLDQVVMVAMLQRETGGSTAEVIDRIAELIRERAELRQIVRTLTAQGRMSRWVVTALPAVLLLLVTAVNPSYMAPLYSTSTGHTLLALGVAMAATGSWAIKRIVDVKV